MDGIKKIKKINKKTIIKFKGIFFLLSGDPNQKINLNLLHLPPLSLDQNTSLTSSLSLSPFPQTSRHCLT